MITKGGESTCGPRLRRPKLLSLVTLGLPTHQIKP